MTATRLATLDLPEGNAMRAPGDAPGSMAFEIAIDEMAHQLKLDPVEFRIHNDTQQDPEKPTRVYSTRKLVECLRTGADKFGWSRRNAQPGNVRDGRWLVGWAWRPHIAERPCSTPRRACGSMPKVWSRLKPT